MEVLGAPNPPNSPEQIDQALSAANVLRLRGELDAARALCNQVLAAKPENEAAYGLMGDILLDQGDEAGALQWYEIALSHHPGSAMLRRKAEDARIRVESHEAFNTARRLGLPTTQNKAQWFTLGLLGAVLLIAALAFIIGGQLQQQSAARVIRTPLEINPVPSVPSPTEPQPRAERGILEDQEIRSKLLQIIDLRDRLQGASYDPRGPRIRIILEAPEGEFTTDALAQDAVRVLAAELDVDAVEVRYVRGGRTLAMAELQREAWEAARNANRPIAGALKNVWPVLEPEAPPVSPPPAAAEPSRAPADRQPTETAPPAEESNPSTGTASSSE